jgi:hypothetical protein
LACLPTLFKQPTHSQCLQFAQGLNRSAESMGTAEQAFKPYHSISFKNLISCSS